MSYFNEDQEDYMRDLAKIPPEERCWCGWFRWGECFHCREEHRVGTAAEKMAARTVGYRG